MFMMPMPATSSETAPISATIERHRAEDAVDAVGELRFVEALVLQVGLAAHARECCLMTAVSVAAIFDGSATTKRAREERAAAQVAAHVGRPRDARLRRRSSR